MNCYVLGAGGMMPMPARFTTSVMLRKDGEMLMFDAGEGIQIPLKRSGLGIAPLNLIAISHLHADHILGLPGILMFRAQCESPGPLTIIGPRGTKRFVQNTIKDLRYHINYNIKYIEINKDSPNHFTWNDGKLYWHRLKHSVFCVGYRYVENNRPGKFDLDKARELNIPPGPLYGKLQQGQPVTLPDGRQISPDEVVGPYRNGRIVSFATDTLPCTGLRDTIADADIAFAEGMFGLVHQKEAQEKCHSTAASTASLAAEAGTRKLVLVHISPRYTLDGEKQLETEAREHYPQARIARTGDSFEIQVHK